MRCDACPMPLAACLSALLLAALALCSDAPGGSVAESVDVEPVWSAHPVGFCLLTHGQDQFVAYYDAGRQLTVAQRKLTSTKWALHKLPRRTGWDSHNYVTLAIDSARHLHLSGDMHCVPLFYLRTARPLEAATLAQDLKTPLIINPDKSQIVMHSSLSALYELDEKSGANLQLLWKQEH